MLKILHYYYFQVLYCYSSSVKKKYCRQAKKKKEEEEWRRKKKEEKKKNENIQCQDHEWSVSHNIGRNLFDTVTGHKSNEEVFPPSRRSISSFYD